MRETDRIICVDTQKHGGNVTDFVGEEIACIDHHPTFVPAEYRYQDIRITGACATLVAEYYALSGIEPDKDTATALLYGMKMDTLQFTRGVTELDIRMFGYLFPRCDQEKLSDLERNNMEFNDLKAYGAAIENIELYDRVGFSTIPFPCPDALVAVISDFILSLVEVEVAVVSSFRKNGVKLSVRSEIPEIHAGNLLPINRQGTAGHRGRGRPCLDGRWLHQQRAPAGARALPGGLHQEPFPGCPGRGGGQEEEVKNLKTKNEKYLNLVLLFSLNVLY